MKAVLPPEARDAWLEQFGEPTRHATWAASRPTVFGVHFVDAAELRAEMDLQVQQEGELLIVAHGALGDVAVGDVIVCGGRSLEVQHGPLRIHDTAWDIWGVFSERG